MIVIIVTYNHEDNIERAIRSVLSQKSRHQIKLVVIDNNSKDKTGQIIKKLKKEKLSFEYIVNESNLGFTGGCNIVFNKYLSTTDYFYLHNADAYFESEAVLDNLLLIAESKKENSILQPAIVSGEQSHLESFKQLSYLGSSYEIQTERSSLSADKVAQVSGIAMLISTKILKQIGLFVDSYFAYGEDSEFCSRARMAAFNCEIVKEVKVIHASQYERYRSFKYFLIERNRLYFLAAFYSPLSMLFLMPVIALSVFVNAVVITSRIGFKTVIEVYRDILENGSKYSSSRRRLNQYTNRKSMIELYSLMSGQLLRPDKKGVYGIFARAINAFTSFYFALFKFVHRHLISRVAY